VLGAIAMFVYLRTRDLAPEVALARLPSGNAAVLSIDFAALRRGGIFEMLSGPAVEEEPEYKTFVEKTAFDYRRDLDRAIRILNWVLLRLAALLSGAVWMACPTSNWPNWYTPATAPAISTTLGWTGRLTASILSRRARI